MQTKRRRAVYEALLLEALGFIFVSLLIWVNDYLDLPHRLLGAGPTPFRPVQVAIESGFVLALGAAVTGVSWLTFRRLAYLESMLTLCASCQRVGDEGRWMHFEQFVEMRDSTATTHGMCPDCQTSFAPTLARKSEGA
jgi:hypothetical protein